MKKKKELSITKSQFVVFRIMCPIHYFHMDHNAPCFITPPTPPPTPEFCTTIVSNFTWVLQLFQQKSNAKF